jgi:hypothetical protein
MNNDIFTRIPVDRCSNTMSIGRLEGVNHSEEFHGIPTSRGWVGEDEADGLFGVNDENRADGKSNALRIHIGGILVIKPT